MTDKKFSTLIKAMPGQGARQAAATAPGPVLWADADHAAEWIGDRVIPYKKGDVLPELQPDSIVAVEINTWADWKFVSDIVLKGSHPFSSFVVDSIPMLQRRLKHEIRGDQPLGDAYEKEDYDVWGQLLYHLEQSIESLLTMKKHPTKKCVNLIYTTDVDKTAPHLPAVEGQLANTLSRWFDIVGYMSRIDGKNKDGKAVTQYGMDISPATKNKAEALCHIPGVVAKYGNHIPNFTFSRVTAAVSNNKKETTNS